jgi:hypothetical protein
LLKDESIGVCEALSYVQREVMVMTKDELSNWFRSSMEVGQDLDDVLQGVAGMNDHPFARPYHWAGLQVVGDV